MKKVRNGEWCLYFQSEEDGTFSEGGDRRNQEFKHAEFLSTYKTLSENIKRQLYVRIYNSEITWGHYIIMVFKSIRINKIT